MVVFGAVFSLCVDKKVKNENFQKDKVLGIKHFKQFQLDRCSELRTIVRADSSELFW